MLRSAPAPLFLLSRLVARQRLQGRGDRRGRRRGARRLRHLPRGAGAAVLVARPGLAEARPRRGAALPLDGALPGPGPGVRAVASSAAGPRPGRPGDLAPPALGHHRGDQGAAHRRHARGRRPQRGRRGRRRGACPDGQRVLGSAQPGPVAGDDDAAPGLHPLVPGRPDADGELGRGPVPLPRPRRRRASPTRCRRDTSCSGLDEKYLLKRAFADLVPDEIIHRPKQPYRAPDAASFFSARPARVARRGDVLRGGPATAGSSTPRWSPACSPSARARAGHG